MPERTNKGVSHAYLCENSPDMQVAGEPLQNNGTSDTGDNVSQR